ncbi:BT_3987 domain-containing protein [Prevotella sp. KH2C16]|uniref:BT_3987 domain-containing protein n=1 Tax=Prevotella sp. KH2C16 TaxID=1855325 RepID=UPI0008DF74E2|nr:DUF1735 domain-containing protein [Prevotella sp. KH2C16]SFG03064.1 F5/8 type C domain-containing protein [Prevotella sp. KH2C16]
MKLKNILLLGGALLFGTAFLASCSSDDDYDVDGYSYTRAYFAKARSTTDGMVVSTPVGIVTSLTHQIIVKSTAAATSDTKITLGFDNSLVDSYNKSNGTTYLPMPEGALELSSTTATIKSGEMASADTISVTISKTEAARLNDANGYLAPIVIKSAGGGMQPSSDAAVVYVHLRYSESSINDDATALLGSAYDLSLARNEWKLVSSKNFDESTFTNLFEASSWSRYFAFKEKAETAQCVIDLGKTQNITGFLTSSELMKGANVEISTDNASWTTLGYTADHKTFSIQEGWSTSEWYVLYAAMQARYVRISIDLDQDSYYWQYLNYSWGKSYCSLSGFNIAIQ